MKQPVFFTYATTALTEISQLMGAEVDLQVTLLSSSVVTIGAFEGLLSSVCTHMKRQNAVVSGSACHIAGQGYLRFLRASSSMSFIWDMIPKFCPLRNCCKSTRPLRPLRAPTSMSRFSWLASKAIWLLIGWLAKAAWVFSSSGVAAFSSGICWRLCNSGKAWPNWAVSWWSFWLIG